MSTYHPSDVLPMLNGGERGFDLAMRGYDRDQVDRYMLRADEDLRVASGQRDAALARSADLAAQLSAVQAQLESLRRQLRIANETITPENVDARIRHLVEAAQADASRLRTETEAKAEEVRSAMAEQAELMISESEAEAARIRAEADTEAAAVKAAADSSAARVLALAQTEADELLAAARAKCVEADEYHAQQVADADAHRAFVESDIAWLAATAASERERLDAEAEAERARLDDARQQLDEESALERARLDSMHAATRERLDREAEAARQVAEEDFEIVLRNRRTAERESSDAMIAAAKAEAARVVREAEDHAAELVFNAEVEVRRLHAERDAAHETLKELHTKVATAIAVALAPTPHAS